MKNYSRQREAILEVIRSTDTHPTASWIYEKVREKIPNISLGTIYRNLAALTENGDILSINVGDGFEHFDGDILPHAHLHCRNCKGLYDAKMKNAPISKIANEQGFITDTTIYIAYGLCKNCCESKN